MLVSPYSDAYFLKARDTLRRDGRDPVVTMQVFQRKNAVLSGLNEAVSYIKGHARIHSLATLAKEGMEIKPWQTIMHIVGFYREFAHLETQYLGILARSTMIATNMRAVVDAANGKPIFFMGARHTHWKTQESDGAAAMVGGATYVGTDAHGSAVGDRGMGTMPHSLIAVYGGDLGEACRAFAEHNAGPVTALVDFNNDSLGDTKKANDVLGKRLAAVRLDTSGSLIDKCMEAEGLHGVNPDLVFKVRRFLDNNLKRPDVKIVVSGGFNADKIMTFESLGVPVDMYGVGSSVLVGSNDFTADIVKVDGKLVSKVGRGFTPVGEICGP